MGWCLPSTTFSELWGNLASKHMEIPSPGPRRPPMFLHARQTSLYDETSLKGGSSVTCMSWSRSSCEVANRIALKIVNQKGCILKLLLHNITLLKLFISLFCAQRLALCKALLRKCMKHTLKQLSWMIKLALKNDYWRLQGKQSACSKVGISVAFIIFSLFLLVTLLPVALMVLFYLNLLTSLKKSVHNFFHKSRAVPEFIAVCTSNQFHFNGSCSWAELC